MRRATTPARLGFAAAFALIGALPLTARTQEAIPTAVPGPDGGAPMAADAPPLRLSDRFDRGPDILRPVGPCGGPAKTEDGKTDKTPHGEVWAGVGTHGYRDIGGAVCVPLGQDTAVSLAIDAGQLNGWSRRR